jgi:hypothetical protein
MCKKSRTVRFLGFSQKNKGRHISRLLRVEVSVFVLSPEIEDRDEVEVDNWAKHKKTFYSE